MLVAGGFAEVINATGAVDTLVEAAIGIMGGNKIIAATMITLNWEKMIAASIRGMLKWMKVGTQVSQMWLCCPSAFRPDVGPRVESEAGEPASPRATFYKVR